MKKLGKKQLTVELEQAIDAVPAQLAEWNLVLKPGGHTLQRDFDANDANFGVAPLLRRMDEMGLAIKDVNTQQSSLEDIFVSLVHDRSHDKAGAAQ